MAEPHRRPETRLFRTYAARGVRESQRQAGPLAVQWFQPPNLKRAFSSSLSDSNLSPAVASDDPDDPDDPDFSGSPVGPRLRRPWGRGSQDQWTLTDTPRIQRLRPRPPQKCSTPCSQLRPSRFPNCNPDCLDSDLSVCIQSRDSNELGTSASLFSSPASPGAPDSLDADSAVPGDIHFPASSPGEASLPCPQEAATGDGRYNERALRAEAGFRPSPFSLMNSGTAEDNEFGTDGENVKESGCERQQMGNRLTDPDLASLGKRTASCKKVVSQDHGESSACKDLRGPGEISMPERSGPLRKRKQRGAVRTSPLHYHQSMSTNLDPREGSMGDPRD